MSGKVSIIIPNYNSLPFLEETIEKVFSQNYDNYEVIIIDDGSTDGSLEYLQSLSKPNLLVKRNFGSGACDARNYGFELSTGEYIQYLDADDYFSADKLEEQVKLLEKVQSKVAVCSTVHFTNSPEEGKITDRPFLFNSDKPSDFLLNLYGADGKNHNMVQTSAWLTPRSLIEKAGKWNKSLYKDQDGEFFSRVLMQSSGVVFAENVFNYYRKHPRGNNIANQTKKKHIVSQIKALESKMSQLSDYSSTLAFKNAMALQAKIIAIDAYPQYKDLSNEALKISQSFGGSMYLPVLGGKLIELLKFSMGWKNAKLIRLFLHRIRERVH